MTSDFEQRGDQSEHTKKKRQQNGLHTPFQEK